jgi:hypothetical protein
VGAGVGAGVDVGARVGVSVDMSVDVSIILTARLEIPTAKLTLTSASLIHSSIHTHTSTSRLRPRPDRGRMRSKRTCSSVALIEIVSIIIFINIQYNFSIWASIHQGHLAYMGTRRNDRSIFAGNEPL